ncbi:putative quinol monooxygenase [Zunongwangia sp.]|uniref:putative quinol monooxygenase n=1 Tax=Zunongwangia sp. TaxID=1965325 RepID=UPI003AA9707D
MKLKNIFFLLAVISIQLPINAQDSLEKQETIQQLKILPLRDGAFDSFLSLMDINITESKKEDGVLNSLLYRQQSNTKTMVLFERFKNQESFEAHNDKVYARSTNGIAPAATAMRLETITLSTIPEISIDIIQKNTVFPENASYSIYIVKNGNNTGFIQAAKQLVNEIRTQEDNESISVFQDSEDTNRFIIFEQWATKDALASFERSSNFKQFNAITSPLLVSKNRELLQSISE